MLRALIPWQRARHYPFTLCTEASMNLVEYDEIMEAMIQAGFTSVFVGVETPTAAALLATKKKQCVRKDDPEYPLHAVHTLQAKGFEVLGGFILGLDGDTPAVFDTHIRFIQHAAIPMAMEGLLTVLKGTDLYYAWNAKAACAATPPGTIVASLKQLICWARHHTFGRVAGEP